MAPMRVHTVVAIPVVFLAIAASEPLSGQNDDVARLRAAIAASPDDPRARCELAFALVRAGQHQEAVDIATVAIDAMRARSDRVSVRLLGACLYNRGRGRSVGAQQRSQTTRTRSISGRTKRLRRASANSFPTDRRARRSPSSR